MDVAAAPLVLETAPEVAFGRDPGLPVCEREQLEAAVGNCPAGSQVGAGALDLATPRGARTVTVDVFAAPGGNALALAATGDGGRKSVVAEAAPSRISIPWTDLVAAGGGGGVVAFTLRIDAASGWVRTTGCSSGSWPVRAAMAGDTADDAVACSAGPAAPPAGGLCGPAREGVRCIEGGGRRSRGGGEKVSHAGWPAITGIVAVADAAGRSIRGTALDDELLGHHGSDTLVGDRGSDVIWGDHLPKGNGPRQRDRLDGGAGDDFLYASHGRNVLLGGAGDDVLWAYFAHGVNRVAGGAGDDVIWERSGRGTIDCGPGRDLVHARLRTPYRPRGCERIDYYRGRAGPR
jgi:Ca2+-binding RTX toxin-like protein